MIRLRERGVVATAVVTALLLGGCSSVPDAANPAQWYRNTVDYLTTDSPEKAKAPAKEDDKKSAASGPASERDQPPPGADKAFPQIASVPTERSRRPPAQGLVADPNRPRYAPAVQRQSETDTPMAAPPAPPAVAPAPPAAPRPPVTTGATASSSRPTETAAAPASRASAGPQPAPTSPTASQVPPPGPTSVADVFRARLAQQQQLPAGARADMAGRMSPQSDLGTVVISSAGIQNAAPPPQANAPLRPPPPTGRRASSGAPSALPALSPGLRSGASGAGVNARSVRVATIQFTNGSSRLDAESERILGDVARLQRQKGGTVRVVGHSSSRTRAMPPDQHDRVNYGISAARADAIAKTLARMGVPRQDIHAGAAADSQPLYHEVMPTGEAGNRRAEVYIDF